MDIRAAEITSILKDQIKNFGQEAQVSEIGQVLSVGDGIARVYGLDKVQAGEMVEFPGGIRGMALNLENDNVVRQLVLRQQVFAARVDGKVPWLLSARRNVDHWGQRAHRFVYGKYRDTVVTSVRRIDKFPIGMHSDFSSIVSPGKVLWQR